MAKKAFTLLIILLMGIFVYWWSDLSRPLYYAFSGSGANVEELKIQAWGKLDNPLNSAMEMEQALTTIVSQFIPEQDLGFSAFYTDEKQGVSTESANLYATVQTLKPSGETYLILTFKEEGLSGELKTSLKKIRQGFAALDVEPRISVFLTGTVDKKLAQKEQEQLVQKVLRRIGARKVEGVSLPEVVSLTGYSPLIKDYLKVGSRRINLNVATSFDEIENKTIVRLGTPLLNGEY